ncbi:MAG: hypothetical protein GY950_18495 [bacterium]|nr:hypothetical protein [bacterium]
MSYFVIGYKTETVFVLIENELKVHIVSSKSLEVLKTVKLEVPAFYKKMPETFYAWKRYGNGNNNFARDLEKWDMGYSSMQKAVVQNGRLVVQVRTANPKMKKFALLFYNADTFKLEKTVFLNDFLLGAKDGKFYCFANGNPGRDEDTDDCIINIYSFRGKK